jgi:hypothetical protein
MLPKTISTEELRLLTKYAKASITELEQAGVIKRDGPNAWPLPDTLAKLVTYLRERVRRTAVSDDKRTWEKARAAREKLRLMKESREVCFVKEFMEFVDAVYGAHVKHYGPVAARIGQRDVALRRLAEKELAVAQQGLSNEMKRLGKALEDGEAA